MHSWAGGGLWSEEEAFVGTVCLVICPLGRALWRQEGPYGGLTWSMQLARSGL